MAGMWICGARIWSWTGYEQTEPLIPGTYFCRDDPTESEEDELYEEARQDPDGNHILFDITKHIDCDGGIMSLLMKRETGWRSRQSASWRNLIVFECRAAFDKWARKYAQVRSQVHML